MTEATLETERPLVTFALFACNQEKYIREAVEGAFSQSYEPLEIILSDDCSSDRTFEMREMAAEYKGAHRLGLQNSEQMPDFVFDPYLYLAHSDLFVLSCACEGLPAC